MANKPVLVLGAGVAGCSLAYFLKRKGYDATVLESDSVVGGMSRTYYYAGHPYEFGPHIWFWPDDTINDVVRELTNNELFHIERRLFSYIEKDDQLYRYPVHYQDVERMPDAKEIDTQLRENRDDNMKLIPEKLPTLGECTFEEYFLAALGKGLYGKFMENYTWKMWGIPGNTLQTSMVWADMVKHRYEKLKGYDPLKFEDTTLGKGLAFQVYPKAGWNVVWEGMVKGSNLVTGCRVIGVKKDRKGYFVNTSGGKHYFADYLAVINTLDVDELWGEKKLPYNGRIVLPLMLKGNEWALPQLAESVYYSGSEFQTRVTEIKRVTHHESPDTVLLIEIPVSGESEATFTGNVKSNANFRPRAYPRQSKEGLAMYAEYVTKGSAIDNLFHSGRHGDFKYWGMPEVVDAAYQLVKTRF